MKAIEIKNLTINRKNFKLHIDELSIENGQKVAILGENGSGKTTLLLAIAGFIDSDIKVFSSKVSRLKPIKRAGLISFLPQTSDFSLDSPAFRVVMLGRYHLKNGLFDREDFEKTKKIFRDLKIEHLSEMRFKTLSGGQKRLILIAKTINQSSKTILLDEPLSYVDIKYSKIIAEYLKNLEETVISSIHDINLAKAYFDRIIILKNGKILFDGQSDSLKKEVVDEAYEINSTYCSDRFIFF